MWIFLMILLTSTPLCFGAVQSIVLDPIIIEKEYAHEGTVFSSKLSSALPVDAITAIPDYSASVDLRKRAASGIQQDVSIRGSMFEDNSAVINGIVLNDPQTGHFSMDIPLTSADVESVRIEKNALAIDYVTHPPSNDGVILTNSWGQAASLDNLVSCSFGTAALRNRFSFQHERSDGLRPNTDFTKYTASFSSLYSSDAVDVEVTEGYLKKDFGADGFYGAPAYIQEEEHIEKNVVMLRTKIKNAVDLEITPYCMLNRDRFLLDRNNPDFYTNIHRTRVLGIKNKLSFQNGAFAELETKEESIDSTNLMKHVRTNTQALLGIEHIAWGDFSMSGSAGVSYYSGKWPVAGLCSLECTYHLTPSLEPYFLFTTQYRLPSFTELYYVSPTNQGNASLDIQRTDNFELGIRQRRERSLISAAGFIRAQKDTIDWVRDASNSPWQAENIGNLNARGIDAAYSYKIPSSQQEFSVNYTFLYLDKNNPYQFSKYVFNYLRHKAVFLYHLTCQKFVLTPALVYEQPHSSAAHSRWLGNIKISYAPQNNLTYFVEAENLFNTGYEEFDFIKAAGRFWKAGVTASF